MASNIADNYYADKSVWLSDWLKTSLSTKTDRLSQWVPDIDHPACKKVLANTLSTACLVHFANMAPCIKVWIKWKRDHLGLLFILTSHPLHVCLDYYVYGNVLCLAL